MKKVSKKNYIIPILLIVYSINKEHYAILLISLIVLCILIIYNLFGQNFEKYEKYNLEKFLKIK